MNQFALNQASINGQAGVVLIAADAHLLVSGQFVASPTRLQAASTHFSAIASTSVSELVRVIAGPATEMRGTALCSARAANHMLASSALAGRASLQALATRTVIAVADALTASASMLATANCSRMAQVGFASTANVAANAEINPASAGHLATAQLLARPVIQRMAATAANSSVAVVAQALRQQQASTHFAMTVTQSTQATRQAHGIAKLQATALLSSRLELKKQAHAASLIQTQMQAFAHSNAAALDPPERTMLRPLTEREMFRPFIEREMQRHA